MKRFISGFIFAILVIPLINSLTTLIENGVNFLSNKMELKTASKIEDLNQIIRKNKDNIISLDFMRTEDGGDDDD
jgi:hypothetical protein